VGHRIRSAIKQASKKNYADLEVPILSPIKKSGERPDFQALAWIGKPLDLQESGRLDFLQIVYTIWL
jgi:hypothetical protein